MIHRRLGGNGPLIDNWIFEVNRGGVVVWLPIVLSFLADRRRVPRVQRPAGLGAPHVAGRFHCELDATLHLKEIRIQAIQLSPRRVPRAVLVDAQVRDGGGLIAEDLICLLRERSVRGRPRNAGVDG